MCSCDNSPHIVCRATSNSPVLKFYFTLPAYGAPDVVVKRVQIWRVSINPREGSLAAAWRSKRWEVGGCLRWKSIILSFFKYMLTKFYSKVCILLLNNCGKISCKNMHALLKYQQKSGAFFFIGPLCIFFITQSCFVCAQHGGAQWTCKFEENQQFFMRRVTIIGCLKCF